MKKHTLEYVNFFGKGGLQEAICKELGIEYDNFNSYHNVVGGEYKNLWHLWLWIVDERLYNGSYMPECFGDKLVHSEIIERWKNENTHKYLEMARNGEDFKWISDFFDACQRVFDKFGGDYSELIVYYYW